MTSLSRRRNLSREVLRSRVQFRIPRDFDGDSVGSRFAPGPADESAHGNKQTPSGTRDLGPDVLCVCPWNSPGSATPSAATPSAATRSATAASSGNASSGTPRCTITVYGDCVLHRQRYRIWHPRLERYRRSGSGSIAARNAHSDYESCALQRNVLGPRYGGRNTQTPFGRLYPRLRRGATIRPPIRSRDRDSGPALTGPRSFSIHNLRGRPSRRMPRSALRAIIAPRLSLPDHARFI